jgi:hypothetical protein
MNCVSCKEYRPEVKKIHRNTCDDCLEAIKLEKRIASYPKRSCLDCSGDVPPQLYFRCVRCQWEHMNPGLLSGSKSGAEDNHYE